MSHASYSGTGTYVRTYVCVCALRSCSCFHKPDSRKTWDVRVHVSTPDAWLCVCVCVYVCVTGRASGSGVIKSQHLRNGHASYTSSQDGGDRGGGLTGVSETVGSATPLAGGLVDFLVSDTACASMYTQTHTHTHTQTHKLQQLLAGGLVDVLVRDTACAHSTLVHWHRCTRQQSVWVRQTEIPFRA